ncbi:GLPGLI family protein [uncultured Alistipes sp.]|uniref:GLPGLI family protein n=1 Tax=uncultured Alistipes sp. TaxID=538949 RepID=UPI00261DEF73|nr:GLPGLI family protein [uncultured Alistipes sp.]
MTGMNKTSLLLLAACMLCGTGFGQGIERRRAGLDPRNYPNGTAILNDGELQYLGLSLLRADTIDTVRHTVEYGFSYPDRDEPDPMLLEIGDSLTAFYSRRAMADDSLYTATLRQNRPRRVQTTAPGWRLYGRIGSRSVEQVHRIPFHEETVTVGETLPLEWRIDTLRQTVLGFVCYRATTRYGGREWQAWFAPEIPIPAGPWKLRGLPGLILCAQDAEGLFSFRCRSIATAKRPLLRYAWRTRPMRREEWLAFERRMHETPHALFGSHTLIISLKKHGRQDERWQVAYRPLELE